MTQVRGLSLDTDPPLDILASLQQQDNPFTSNKSEFCGVNSAQLECTAIGFPCGIPSQAGTQQREETLSRTFFCLCANTSTTKSVGYQHVRVMAGRQVALLSTLGKCPAQSPAISLGHQYLL